MKKLRRRHGVNIKIRIDEGGEDEYLW